MAPYGRGGAGNYEAIQRENEKISKDLEASQSAAEKATNNYLPPDIAERSEAQYAHTGRGGAGNYYSPKDLAEHGNFSGAQTSHIRKS
jgi:predicted transcriptional regulator